AVERSKDAVQQSRHEQEGAHVLADALFDHGPACNHYEGRDERVEQDEQHRDAVHPEVVVDIEALDPLVALDELHARVGQAESRIERDRDEEAEYRAPERDGALHRRVAVSPAGEHQQAGQDRNPDGEAEEHQWMKTRYLTMA